MNVIFAAAAADDDDFSNYTSNILSKRSKISTVQLRPKVNYCWY